MYLELWTFQLTASRGGWRNFCPTLPATPTYFNSQPHEEADLSPHSIEIPCRYFNSQPHEEADDSTIMRCTPFCYFNSQPHEEADGSEPDRSYIKGISTHSLTRRLTVIDLFHKKTSLFQLTASRGGWRAGRRKKRWKMIISTHSLTRRLTELKTDAEIVNFISTHSLTRRLT